jgi:hypothetical protein
VIYAIRAVGTDYIKFGRARDVLIRLTTLQIGCPTELQLEAYCDGDKTEECWVHWQLYQAGLFHRGEWFKDGPKAQEIIRAMKANQLKADGAPSQVITIERLRNKRLSAALNVKMPSGWAIK